MILYATASSLTRGKTTYILNKTTYILNFWAVAHLIPALVLSHPPTRQVHEMARKGKERITFEELVRLYVNYKPVAGVSQQQVRLLKHILPV